MIPTPTPLPPGVSLLDFDNVSWGEEASRNAIQTWNMANQSGMLTNVQVFIIILLIMLGAGAIVAMLKRL